MLLEEELRRIVASRMLRRVKIGKFCLPGILIFFNRELDRLHKFIILCMSRPIAKEEPCNARLYIREVFLEECVG